MNQYPNQVPDEQDPERFYEQFWRLPSWGSPEPNDDERSRLAAIERMLQRSNPGHDLRILDLGCGRGWLTAELRDHGRVLGTDVVAAAVERARELFPDLRFEQADLEGLVENHGRESFDLVVSSEVLEHVPAADKAGFLSGIHRLLTPGGHVVLTTPRGELWQTWHTGDDLEQPVEEWVSESELDQLVEAAGFELVARTRAHVYPITLVSRVFASRPWRLLSRWLQPIDRLTYGSRIYQVVLLRKSS